MRKGPFAPLTAPPVQPPPFGSSHSPSVGAKRRLHCHRLVRPSPLLLSLVNLWNGLPHYQKDESGIRFRAWLSRLIRNTAVDWFRRQSGAKRETSLETAAQDSLPVNQPALETAIQEEWQRYVLGLAVQQLKRTFSGKALDVLMLSLQGVSSEEIGERLGIQTNSVYVLKTRIKTHLQREIKRIRAELEYPHHLS